MPTYSALAAALAAALDAQPRRFAPAVVDWAPDVGLEELSAPLCRVTPAGVALERPARGGKAGRWDFAVWFVAPAAKEDIPALAETVAAAGEGLLGKIVCGGAEVTACAYDEPYSPEEWLQRSVFWAVLIVTVEASHG